MKKSAAFIAGIVLILAFTVYLAQNEEEINYFDGIVEKSFEEKGCEIKQRSLGESYYRGPMIDTHIHIPSIPDSEGVEYSETPSMGVNVWIEDYICMMEQENTTMAFAFFPVWDPISENQIELVKRTLEKHPQRFVPFIMPPDDDGSVNGYPTVDSEKLTEFLSRYPGMFRGYGEIGLYERGDHGGPKGAPALPPDSQRMMEIYPVIKENELIVYFHLGEGQKESFDRILKENREIIFIFHGDQLVVQEDDNVQNLSEIDDLLYENPNLYYGVDELYGGVWLLKPEVSKGEFLAHFSRYEEILDQDVKTWKEFIERHPDQVIWGTDRGWSAPWSLDEDVAMALNNYTRAFIARLDPDVQEKFAYKNAERILDRI